MAVTRTRPGRAALLRTAVELMGEKGYDGTSTRDIAAAAGVSVAALYYHFPSKLDLLREFLHDAHDIVLARLARDVEAAGPDPEDRLDAAVATLVWSHLHDDVAQQATRVAYQEHGRLPEPERRAVADKRERIVEVVAAVVADGVAAGTFTTSDPHAVARAVLTLCVSVVEPFPGESPALDDAVAQHQRFAAALARTAPSRPPTRKGKASGLRRPR